MATDPEIRELEAEKLRAEIASVKAEASKFRAEGAYLRRKDALLKQEKDDQDASTYEQRILEFTKEVDGDSVNEAITTLSEWRARSKEEITIRITSQGGECVQGLAFYDYILSLRAENIKVITVGLGWAASMAGILLQAGTKRYVAPNMHMLIHEVAIDGLPYLKLPDLEDEAKLMKSLQDRGTRILAERSTLSSTEIERKMKRKDWWLTAEEVVQYGFADGLWPPARRKR